MTSLLNSIAFYCLTPLYVALVLLLIFFHVPDSFLPGLFYFYAIITGSVLLGVNCFPVQLQTEQSYDWILEKLQYKPAILTLCFIILVCAPLDIYVNGFKLLHPSTYTHLPGIGRYLRHITNLCWIFIPVAFIFINRLSVKILFIAFAILFPILIIDRNRLFIACYSLLFCIALTYSDPSTPKKIRLMGSITCGVLLMVSVLVFATIGHFRSGSQLVVLSSGKLLTVGKYPLTDLFSTLPVFFQQIILYITSPIFNFITIDSLHFTNDTFLLSQFSPFSRSQFQAYPFAPILIPRFNVGTEFYPFLLYGGFPMAIGAFLVMLLSFMGSAYGLKKSPNIFTFLIFIKISYCVIFMGFAPQFFILFNLMFVVLMIFLWVLSNYFTDFRLTNGIN